MLSFATLIPCPELGLNRKLILKNPYYYEIHIYCRLPISYEKMKLLSTSKTERETVFDVRAQQTVARANKATNAEIKRRIMQIYYLWTDLFSFGNGCCWGACSKRSSGFASRVIAFEKLRDDRTATNTTLRRTETIRSSIRPPLLLLLTRLHRRTFSSVIDCLCNDTRRSDLTHDTISRSSLPL